MRRIFVRIQGVTTNAYFTYSSVDTTRNSDEKTSKSLLLVHFFSEVLSMIHGMFFFTYRLPVVSIVWYPLLSASGGVAMGKHKF